VYYQKQPKSLSARVVIMFQQFKRLGFSATIILFTFVGGCSETTLSVTEPEKPVNPVVSDATLEKVFGDAIQLDNLANYAQQPIPDYIPQAISSRFLITDIGATLGRALFYDTELSVNRTVSCASCHRQDLAFGDLPQASVGVNGTTGRHSMRLVNNRFGAEQRFFWDERATSLEHQSTEPIQDHIEMGFSGQNGNPGMPELIERLQRLPYYQTLFTHAFGEETITQVRMQTALSMFIRSMQSFDAKYDAGRQLARNDAEPFSNFTDQENLGKTMFIQPPVFDSFGVRVSGGIGCATCHRPPVFDIDPNSRNNGVIGQISMTGPDLNNTRSPSLRDVVQADGSTNGPFMHNGALTSLEAVLAHYGTMGRQMQNTNIDPRLRPGGNPQRLNLTAAETAAVVAFLRTLAGEAVYTDTRWSDPFVKND
jgi:cytochrome c peroxidase